MNPKIEITRKTLHAGALSGVLDRLRNADVLVGIPAKTTDRKGKKNKPAPINNASLMYIHTNGSPVQGIPKRPVIEPAITHEPAKTEISKELKEAVTELLSWTKIPDANKIFRHLSNAGQIATDASKSWFTDPRNAWAPNTPATIARKGSDRPLIDTGALRRSLTYIVRLKK